MRRTILFSHNGHSYTAEYLFHKSTPEDKAEAEVQDVTHISGESARTCPYLKDQEAHDEVLAIAELRAQEDAEVFDLSLVAAWRAFWNNQNADRR